MNRIFNTLIEIKITNRGRRRNFHFYSIAILFALYVQKSNRVHFCYTLSLMLNVILGLD